MVKLRGTIRFLVTALVSTGCAAVLAAPAVKQPHSKVPARSPRASAAFSLDGKLLALAGYREVLVREVSSGRTVTLGGMAGEVTCVAFSPDSQTLATSGGVPGKSGEIRLWNLTARTAKMLTGVHSDVVYCVAWAPDGKSLAAGSYDRLVSLWDVASGRGRPMKDHTDAVYSVAFNRTGTRVASASGDRTVKLWDPTTGKRLFTLNDSTAELYSVAFRPTGEELVAVGADKMLRKWSLTATAGTLSGSAFAHDGPIIRAAYTPDGGGIITSSEDRTLRLWDAATLSERRVFERQPDWVLGLAVSPDGKSLAVTRYDGSMKLYDLTVGAAPVTEKPGKPASTVQETP